MEEKIQKFAKENPELVTALLLGMDQMKRANAKEGNSWEWLHDSLTLNFDPLRAFLEEIEHRAGEEDYAFALGARMILKTSLQRVDEIVKVLERDIGKMKVHLGDVALADPGLCRPISNIELISNGNGNSGDNASAPAQDEEPAGDYYASDLIDQIAAGYAAVGDMLRRIEQENDAESASTLASMARVLYKNAVVRKNAIIRELQEKTGKIQVLVDTNNGHAQYDLPIKGVVIHPKQEAGNGC